MILNLVLKILVVILQYVASLVQYPSLPDPDTFVPVEN